MYKRIFVAYDGSTCSVKALDEAILLANALAATLCIAHVDEYGAMHGGMDMQAYVDRVGKVKKIHVQLKQLLDDAITKASSAGCQVERQMVAANHRRPAEAIADAARDWKADLIVVGTHGRRGFQRLLVGSVAEHLTQLADRSLLLVREQ